MTDKDLECSLHKSNLEAILENKKEQYSWGFWNLNCFSYPGQSIRSSIHNEKIKDVSSWIMWFNKVTTMSFHKVTVKKTLNKSKMLEIIWILGKSLIRGIPDVRAVYDDSSNSI